MLTAPIEKYHQYTAMDLHLLLVDEDVAMCLVLQGGELQLGLHAHNVDLLQELGLLDVYKIILEAFLK